MLFIICEPLIEVQEFQARMKNWLGIAYGLGLPKRRTLTKLFTTSQTRYNIETFETTFANHKGISYTSK